MSYLNWDESDSATPIAIIRDGDMHGKVAYLHTDDPIAVSCKAPFSDAEKKLLTQIIDATCRRHSSTYRDRLKKAEILKRAINTGISPREEELKTLFSQIKKSFKEERVGSLEIDNGEFCYIPKTDGRECIYVCGPSGSGKSYWTKNYCVQYNKLFPKRGIYLFSKVDDDESLEGIKNVHRIPLDESFLASEFNASDFEDSLLVFDDTDTVRDSEVRKEIVQLKNDVLEVGRHSNVSIIITSHLISNYKETRTVLNEAMKLVIYPQSGASSQIRYTLDKYFGFDKEHIINILKAPSRWVMCSKHYPQYYMGSRMIKLLR
jgi:hypothetical protein